MTTKSLITALFTVAALGTGHVMAADKPALATAMSNQATPERQVLVFWASWCGACKKVLNDVAALNADLAGIGAQVKTVSLDDSQTTVDLGAISAAQAKHLISQHKVQMVPWVVIVDEKGNPVATPSKYHKPAELAAWLKSDIQLSM